MKRILIVLGAVVILVLPTTASATYPHKHHKHHKHHVKPIPPIVIPPVVIPPAPQEPAVSYCVSTNKGWTYVQLTANALNAGTYWRGLYNSNSTVVIAGNQITFVNIGDAGIRLAIYVSGVGSTC